MVAVLRRLVRNWKDFATVLFFVTLAIAVVLDYAGSASIAARYFASILIGGVAPFGFAAFASTRIKHHRQEFPFALDGLQPRQDKIYFAVWAGWSLLLATLGA